LTRITNIGRFPPPYGGVSNHIKRLHQFLKSNKIQSELINLNPFNVESEHIDESVIYLKGSKLKKFVQLWSLLQNSDADIHHFHTSLFRDFAFVGKFLVKHKIAKSIITIHSGEFVDKYNSLGYLQQKFYKSILLGFDHFYAVNVSQANFFQTELSIDQSKISIIPTFIKPEMQNNVLSERIIAQIDKLNNNCDYLVIICGRIYDFYGYDLLIDAVNNIQQSNGIRIGIIYNFYTAEDKIYKQQLLKRIQENGNSIIFNDFTPEAFLELVSKTSIYVRPTSIDSFGVTVPEALSLGIPVIASDICDRHEGTILFETGNRNDLEIKLVETINDLSAIKRDLTLLDIPDNAPAVLNAYNKLIAENTE